VIHIAREQVLLKRLPRQEGTLIHHSAAQLSWSPLAISRPQKRKKQFYEALESQPMAVL
jgi:hypothetical protein